MKGCVLCGRLFESTETYYVLCDICFTAYRKASAYETRLEMSKRDALFDFACAYCKGKVQAWDHIIPRGLLSSYIAGRTAEDTFALGLGSNLAPVCKSCNSRKGDRDLIWLYAYTGFRKVGGLSRLEEIIMSHRFAPDYWSEFLTYAKELPYSRIQTALNRVAPSRSAWVERQGRSPSPPLLATPKGFCKGQEFNHPVFGRGTITGFEIVLNATDGKEDEYMIVVFERGEAKMLAYTAARLPQEWEAAQKSWRVSDSPWNTHRVAPREGAQATAKTGVAAIFKAGDRVRHAKFGEGVVISCAPAGADEEVTVAFPGDTPKKLLASFAHLEKTG